MLIAPPPAHPFPAARGASATVDESLPAVDGIVQALCNPRHAPPLYAADVVTTEGADAGTGGPPSDVTTVVIPAGAYPAFDGDTVEAAFRFAARMAAGRRGASCLRRCTGGARVAGSEELFSVAAVVERVLAVTHLGPWRATPLEALPYGTWQHAAAAIGIELCSLPLREAPAAAAASAAPGQAGGGEAAGLFPPYCQIRILILRDAFEGLPAADAGVLCVCVWGGGGGGVLGGVC
jgi:hypothetical protein